MPGIGGNRVPLKRSDSGLATSRSSAVGLNVGISGRVNVASPISHELLSCRTDERGFGKATFTRPEIPTFKPTRG